MKHHSGPSCTSAELKEALITSGNWSEKFCDEPCLQRYLRARNMDVHKAHDMLAATLKWRKENRVDELDRSEFDDCRYMREGWVYVDGNDAEGRSVVMFRKRREAFPVKETEMYLRYMMFVLETAVKNMKNRQEQWIWVLDLSVYSPANAPPLSVTLKVLQMLADHYPERLHKGYVVNAPSVFQLAYKVIYPFIDPVTRSKAEFVNTKDYYQPTKSTETWGSWASSMFHSKSHSSSSSSSKGKCHTGSAAACTHSDASVEVHNGGCDAKIVTKGPAGGTFHPFLGFYEKPYCYDRHQVLLSSCGW